MFNTPPVWTGLSRLVPSSCTRSLKPYSHLSPPLCSYNMPSTKQQKSAPHKMQKCLLVSFAGQSEVQVWLCCCQLLFGQRLGASALEMCLRTSTRTRGESGRPATLSWIPRSSAQSWQQGPEFLSYGCWNRIGNKGN